jgi:hypothetical protein
MTLSVVLEPPHMEGNIKCRIDHKPIALACSSRKPSDERIAVAAGFWPSSGFRLILWISVEICDLVGALKNVDFTKCESIVGRNAVTGFYVKSNHKKNVVDSPRCFPDCSLDWSPAFGFLSTSPSFLLAEARTKQQREAG